MASDQSPLTIHQRLELFFHEIRARERAANHDEAMALISSTLNAVEDKFSGIPYNPDQRRTDGRMYPPDERWRYRNWERLGIRCYRQFAHATFIADNGAIEIRSRTGDELNEISFETEGKNGRKVSDYDSSQ